MYRRTAVVTETGAESDAKTAEKTVNAAVNCYVITASPISLYFFTCRFGLWDPTLDSYQEAAIIPLYLPVNDSLKQF